nr:MAG TPA: hypothetical protein [Caudoviricetes sp.]
MTAEVFNQTETMTEEARREYSRQLEKELFGDVQDNRETILPSKPKTIKKDDKVKQSKKEEKEQVREKFLTTLENVRYNDESKRLSLYTFDGRSNDMFWDMVLEARRKKLEGIVDEPVDNTPSNPIPPTTTNQSDPMLRSLGLTGNEKEDNIKIQNSLLGLSGKWDKL